MKAVIYTRISTSKQDEISLDVQEDKCRKQADLLEYEHITVYSDSGKSAKNMNRPGMQDILQMVRAHSVDAIIVYKLDRLTRNVRDLNEFIELCTESGVELVSVTESLNTASAAGRLVINIMGTIAQWEREIIAERVQEALDYRKENGLVYSSQPPYGKRAVDGKLVEDEDEQDTIDFIKAHRGPKWSWERIAARLNESDIPTRSGKPWCWQSVKKIYEDNRKAA